MKRLNAAGYFNITKTALDDPEGTGNNFIIQMAYNNIFGLEE